MKLTKRKIDALEIPKRDCFVWDDELRGFGLRLSPKGKKTFVVQYRMGRRCQRVSLGGFGLLTVEQARTGAKILLGDIASGKNPALTQRKNRQSPTLEEVYQRFLKEHINVRLKPLTQVSYSHAMRKYVLPVLGTRTVIDIRSDDVSALHLNLKHIPIQANRVMCVLSKLFSLCEEWGLRDQGSNPCQYVKHYKENGNARFLDKAEIARLWEALEVIKMQNVISPYAINAVKLLILTGCRLSEIRTLKWSYIRGNHVEFPDTKTGYKRIPLNVDAMAVLGEIPRLVDNDYVICGKKKGHHIVNLQSSWLRIRAKAGLDDVRIHDLRHTFASQAIMGGMSLAVVSKLLGHSKIGTTMRYAHLADEELAKASESIGGFLKPPASESKSASTHHLRIVE